MENNTDQQHWNQHSQRWSLVTSPLRPCSEDLSIFKSKILDNNAFTLLLGVTPELQDLSNNMWVVDNNQDMLENFASSQSHKTHSDWQVIDTAFDRKFDYIIGDGSFNVVSFEKDIKKILGNITKLLEQNGKLVMRFFILPEKQETIQEVINKAYNQLIPNFSAFKWHFAMAVAQDLDTTDIPVTIIHDKFKNYISDFDEFAKKIGWSIEEINTISHYKSSDNIYNFPSLTQVKRITKEFFDIVSIDYANYYLAERCPIVTLKKSINE